MCGISVIAGSANAGEHAASLAAMHAPIRHRGPDDECAVVIPLRGPARVVRDVGALAGEVFAAGMAFRRLKIVDCSDASSQPMRSADGTVWIVFNGEIYNFRQVRRALVACGRTFESHGDTEVILAAYEEWGTDAFARLEGMWAIVIVDTRLGRIVASRDRFGIKPLYYAIDDDRLLFASEIKQLLPVVRERSLDHDMVAAHLDGVREPVHREGFWLGIDCVPPATWFEAPLNDVARPPRFVAYWSLDGCTADRARLYPQSLAELHDVLGDTIQSHLVSDVPIGALLSGGLDSAVVTSLMHAQRGATFPTYSFGFRDAAPESCELPFVDDVVAMKSIANFETTFDARWIIDNARRAIYAMEEPPMAFAAIAQFRTFELVAAHGTTVVLDGQGADEIFAGYPYHERELVLDRLAHVEVRDALRQLRSIGAVHGRHPMSLVATGLIAPWVAERRHRYDWLLQRRRRVDRANYDGARDASRLNRRLHFDVKWGNVRLVLGLGDRNSMAHSVEARVPYFDRRLVELAFSLPDDFKIAEGERKHILRDAGRLSLPKSLTDRRDRMGYAVPADRFLRGGLRDWVRELVSDPRFDSPLFDRARMLRFVDGYYAGRHRDAMAVWRLAALAVWQDAYGVDLR